MLPKILKDVQALVQGTHLDHGGTYAFVEVGDAVRRYATGSVEEFPFVTADFTVTGMETAGKWFGDLQIAVTDLFPLAETYDGPGGWRQAFFEKKMRYQADLVELAMILCGEKDAPSGLSYSYTQAGTAAMEVQADSPAESVPDGQVFHLMRCDITVPLRGDILQLSGLLGL